MRKGKTFPCVRCSHPTENRKVLSAPVSTSSAPHLSYRAFFMLKDIDGRSPHLCMRCAGAVLLKAAATLHAVASIRPGPLSQPPKSSRPARAGSARRRT